MRNTIDLAAVALARDLSFAGDGDPSHGTGKQSLIAAVSLLGRWADY
jgi:3-deoxy-D-arabino-heptulosonate 7-phosphate (DAHP) synthase